MKPRRSLSVLLLVGVAGGCSLFTGLGHMQPVEIRSWFPCEPLVEAAAVEAVRVSFSGPMHRARTEEAFRLSEEDAPLAGLFAWEEDGRTLRFLPCPPLRTGFAYSISVSTAAEDLHGNSLARPLAVRFRTGTDDERPRVTAHAPEEGAVLADMREAVRVRFSEPPEPASVLAGWSITPAVRGRFSWSTDAAEVTFLPLEDYAGGQQYTVRLSGQVCDLSGNRLAEDLEFHFRTVPSAEVQVLSVVCPRSGRVLSPGSAVDLSLGIEKDERFLATLSLPLPPAERGQAIALQPAVPVLLSWNAAADACLVGFDAALQWNRLYTLRVLDQSYAFVVNGADSLPPQVRSIRYCPDIDAPVPQFIELQFAGNYSFVPAPAPAFDFHLDHALNAAIDLGSFMQALSILAGGGCLSLQCRQLAVSPLPVDPDPLPGSGQSVVRLLCSIDDDPGISGPLSFRLDTDLRDSLGNHLAADHVLVVNNNAD